MCFVFLVHLFISFIFLPASAETIRLGLSIKIVEKDPAEIGPLEEWEVHGVVHDTLLGYSPIETVIPNLAESWSFSKGDGTVTFKLRGQARFSNGEFITARDVEASLQRSLVLDKERKSTLTNCLFPNLKEPKIKAGSHPGIVVSSKDSITLKIPGCEGSLIPELAMANYSIVPQTSIENTGKLKRNSAVSGIFQIDPTKPTFTLRPNTFHRAWSKTDTRDIEVAFTQVNPFDHPSKWEHLSAFKVYSDKQYQYLLNKNLHSHFSLPIMTWFLTPVIEPGTPISNAETLVRDLSLRFNPKKLRYFSDNRLEKPADAFFPKDYNCKEGTTNIPSVPLKTLQKLQAETVIVLDQAIPIAYFGDFDRRFRSKPTGFRSVATLAV